MATLGFVKLELVLEVLGFLAVPDWKFWELIPLAFSLLRITLLLVGELELDEGLDDIVEGDELDGLDVAIIHACNWVIKLV